MNETACCARLFVSVCGGCYFLAVSGKACVYCTPEWADVYDSCFVY